MGSIPEIIIFLMVGIVISLFVSALKEGTTSFKIMLMGINITILGGIIAIHTNHSYGGAEYLIAFIGLVISAIGLVKKD